MSTDLTRINSFKTDLMQSHYKTMVNFMKNEDNAKKFMSSVVYSVSKTPKLLDCNKTSLMNAFMQCAEFGMYPSSGSGECYVLPYGKEAQFQLGYQGIISLLYKAGIQSIRTEIIRESDKFSYVNGILHHEIDFFKSNEQRGEVIAVYAIAKVNNEEIVKVMNKVDIEKFKTFSKSAGSTYSPWNIKNDPELHMYRKTVIKQLAKNLPKNEAFNRAIEVDNQDSTVGDKNIEAIETESILNDKLAGFEANEGEVKKIS